MPGWFQRVPLFGRLTLAPPSELHPRRRAGHFLFSSLRVLALTPLSTPCRPYVARRACIRLAVRVVERRDADADAAAVAPSFR